MQTVARRLRRVHCDSRFVEIALQLEAGIADELFILRLVDDRLVAKSAECAQRFQVNIDHAVAFGQQPRGLRRRLSTQVQRRADGGEENNYDQWDPDSSSSQQ